MLEPWCALCLLCFWPSGMYPMDQSEYPGLRSAIERLTLNDSSVTVQRDSSLALGAGWRWGPNRLAQQTSTYALVTNQKRNAKVLLNQSRLLGAWLFAVRLPNADEPAKWSISFFFAFFPSNLEGAWTHGSERVYHFVSAQMVKVGFFRAIYMTWYKPAAGA